MNKIYKLNPVFKNTLWGGNRLREEFGKDSSDSKIAESWELSTYPDSESTILENGKKLKLSELFKQHPEYLGELVSSVEDFPLLIKLIDAAMPLSVQVHPDDDYAHRVEHEQGKNEYWYILGADDDAYIYYGLKDKLSREEVKKAIDDNTIEEYLNKVYVKPGEGYYIPAGTIHAIGSGCLILEVQQNSDVTYRLYDYNRVDKDGNKRELHIDKALDVINYLPVKNPKKDEEILINTDNFRIREFEVKNKPVFLHLSSASFTYIFCSKGTLNIKTKDDQCRITKGDSILITADNGELEISGKGFSTVVDIAEN